MEFKKGALMHDDQQSDSEVARDSGRDSVPVRPERRVDDTRDSCPDATAKDGRELQRDPLEGIDLDALLNNPILLAQITAQIQQNHLHLPVLTPDHDTMVRMKRDTPELYEVYIEGLRRQVEADHIQRTHPYTEPLKNVVSGRRYGLAAVLAVLVVATVALFLGHPGFATTIIAIDVIALAAVFASPSNSVEDQRKK